MNSTPLSQLGLVALLSAGFSSGLTVLWMGASNSNAAVEPVTSSASQDSEAGLREVLERLAAALERDTELATPVVAREREVVAATPDEAQTDLKAELAELISLLRASHDSGAFQSAAPPLDRSQPARIESLETLVSLEAQDPGAVERELRLQTLPVVVERLGFPTVVMSSQNGNTMLGWEETSIGHIEIEFHDGYAVAIYATPNSK